MLQLIFFLAAAFLWGKLASEILYGIINGYSNEELKYVANLSFRESIKFWGFEQGTTLAALNILRGSIFYYLLTQAGLMKTWEYWLGLSILIVGAECNSNSGKTFWKRWTLTAGFIYLFIPDLFKLMLAFHSSALILSRKIKLPVWLTLIVPAIYFLFIPYPIGDWSFAMLAFSVTAFGFNRSTVHNLVSIVINRKISPQPLGANIIYRNLPKA